MSTLAEQVAAIRPGDTVTVRHAYLEHSADTTGIAHEVVAGSLWIGTLLIRGIAGRLPVDLNAVLDHQPAIPDEPPLWSVAVTVTGLSALTRHPDGWGWGQGQGRLSWAEAWRDHGPLTVRALGVEQ